MQDLARLFLWTLRHYEEIDPIILSGSMNQLRYNNNYTIIAFWSVVSEEDEISIRDVANMIAEAMEFKGDTLVR